MATFRDFAKPTGASVLAGVRTLTETCSAFARSWKNLPARKFTVSFSLMLAPLNLLQIHVFKQSQHIQNSAYALALRNPIIIQQEERSVGIKWVEQVRIQWETKH